MQAFDSHLHLNSPEFEGREETIWQEALDAGVRWGVCIGYDVPTSRKAIELAGRMDNLYASVGVSPHEILQAPDGYIDELRQLAGYPNVVAVGEAGLEYHYDVGPKDVQRRHLDWQTGLANEQDKPLVIHLRDADDDFIAYLETNPPKRGILHCFTASQRVMEKSVEMGLMISFSGIVTFKKATELHAAAAIVPSEHLLIETDSPYLAPVPFRGKRCEPRMVLNTAQKIAELRGRSQEEMVEITARNARRIFGID